MWGFFEVRSRSGCCRIQLGGDKNRVWVVEPLAMAGSVGLSLNLAVCQQKIWQELGFYDAATPFFSELQTHSFCLHYLPFYQKGWTMLHQSRVPNPRLCTWWQQELIKSNVLCFIWQQIGLVGLLSFLWHFVWATFGFSSGSVYASFACNPLGH